MKKSALLLLLLLTVIPSYALKPDRNYLAKPDAKGMMYKEQDIVTPDNYKLKSWLCYPAKENDKKTTLIIAYGDAGNMSYWLDQTAELVKAGFTVVLFDYRGFGESSDFEMNKDYLYYNEFATDLSTVLKWAKTNIKENNTGIWALSMGTIMTTLTLEKEKADFLIAEGYVVSPVKVQQKLKELKNKDILLPQGADKFPGILKKQQIKTLVFAGTEDIVTTADDSKIITGLNSTNSLIVFEGNHLQGFQTLSELAYGDKYISAIINFIK
jgi:alpha/beta superfamily hydrolase